MSPRALHLMPYTSNPCIPPYLINRLTSNVRRFFFSALADGSAEAEVLALVIRVTGAAGRGGKSSSDTSLRPNDATDCVRCRVGERVGKSTADSIRCRVSGVLVDPLLIAYIIE